MPIYPYQCEVCDNRFDVTKSMAEMELLEFCDRCKSLARRNIAGCSLVSVHDWTESFNPAFGCVVKSKAHQREILTRFRDQGREFEEVGNEPVENIHKFFDEKREAKRRERWNESHEKILGEGLK